MEMFQFVSALKWLKERNYNATIASFVDDLATNDFALASSPNISLPKESHDSHVIKKRKLEDGKITKQVVASSSESGNGSDEESNDDSKSSSSSESDTSESDDSDSDDESDSEQRKLASKKKALESLEASKSWLEKASITPSKEKHLPGSGGPKVRNSGEAFKRVDDTEWSKQIKTGLEDNSCKSILAFYWSSL